MCTAHGVVSYTLFARKWGTLDVVTLCSFEGVSRQAKVMKGANRDTAWFAAIDSEWPALKAAFERWLAPENFDSNGRQLQSLASLTLPLISATDPSVHHGSCSTPVFD